MIEILNLTTDYLKQKGVDNARRQAEELLGEALGLGRMGLYLEYDRPLTVPEMEKCREWLKRRAAGEPLQYISGEMEFFGCRIAVTPDVLIPRQETEILVDKIAHQLSLLPLVDKVLWDVCCGSGCIGISLKKKFPELQVCLSDLSEAALAMTRRNAAGNEVDVECLCGDLLAPFEGKKADFIVSNPPYIAAKDYAGLEIEVRGHEPHMALVSGDSGLEFYRRLAQQLPRYLNPQGRVWLEIGHGQSEAIHSEFSASCWTRRTHELDWSGRERFFSLEIE
ncbi:MAG: peptide chain release factor N(5)-glutamine methyltransferase [Parachlamydiaceae bacterium]